MPVIQPGDSWQTIVDANPAGTTFEIDTGTHLNATVVPKSGNKFIGRPGAVLDGNNTTAIAIVGTSGVPTDVEVRNLRLIRYNPPVAYGIINASGDTLASATDGWVVEDNEIAYSSNVGLRIGTNMVARNNRIHHNGTFGLAGPGNDFLIEQNLVEDNGDPTFTAESGASKFVLSTGGIVRKNTWKRNLGPTIWFDIANHSALIEENIVEDSYAEGIVLEISYGGTIIRNNLVRRSGLDDSRSAAWAWGAGIGIHATGDATNLTEVYGNCLEGNAHGISLIQQARGTNHGDPVYVDPEMIVQNLSVHDNTITSLSTPGHLHAGSFGSIWVVDDTGTNGLYDFATRNISIDNNKHYIRPSGDSFPFAINNAQRNFAYWQGTALLDVNGAQIVGEPPIAHRNHAGVRRSNRCRRCRCCRCS